MHLFFVLLSTCFGFFVWMYALTYFLSTGADDKFASKTRIGCIRGMLLAGIFLLSREVPYLRDMIGHDWIFFPIVFLLISLPFSFAQFRFSVVIPILLGLLLAFFWSADIPFFWSSFHEEIGKWYQSLTSTFPAVFSPFVGVGFSVVENGVYFYGDLSLSQILGRTFFSLPLHLFATFFGLWCFYSIPSRILGITIGLLASITIHAFYNWTLDISMIFPMLLIMLGYIFYGWSLENSWYRKKIIPSTFREKGNMTRSP